VGTLTLYKTNDRFQKGRSVPSGYFDITEKEEEDVKKDFAQMLIHSLHWSSSRIKPAMG